MKDRRIVCTNSLRFAKYAKYVRGLNVQTLTESFGLLIGIKLFYLGSDKGHHPKRHCQNHWNSCRVTRHMSVALSLYYITWSMDGSLESLSELSISRPNRVRSTQRPQRYYTRRSRILTHIAFFIGYRPRKYSVTGFREMRMQRINKYKSRQCWQTFPPRPHKPQRPPPNPCYQHSLLL